MIQQIDESSVRVWNPPNYKMVSVKGTKKLILLENEIPIPQQQYFRPKVSALKQKFRVAVKNSDDEIWINWFVIFELLFLIFIH